MELTCKAEAATERWKEKNDTNTEVDLPTTHGQREGSLVRPFMSKRQRKNRIPDTRSRRWEGWGRKREEREGWEAGEGGKNEIKGRGRKDRRGGRGHVVPDAEREFSWKPEFVGIRFFLVVKSEKEGRAVRSSRDS